MVSKIESQTILEAKNLGRLTREGDTWLFRDLSLTVSAGDKLVLTGESGCGKTVLMRSLIFLDCLDSGEILWHGESVEDERVPFFRTRVLYLHQKPVLFSGTVKQNLDRPFVFASNKDRSSSDDNVLRWLAVLGRDESFLHKDSSHLSGGELQMVSVLRSLRLEPEMLLLDEPTSQLDSKSTGLIEELISGWLEERLEERSLVWITHQEEQAKRVASRRMQLSDGMLREVEV